MTILQHLKDRHLNIELHRPIIDEEEQCVSFILYTPTGKLAGYQQYRPYADKKPFNHPKLSKYYTYRKQSTHAVWGIESLYVSNGPIFLTEGIFDSARLTEFNQTSLATLCNNPNKDFLNFLFILSRPIVVVCDNDKAGKMLAKFGHYVEIVPDDKDLGESSDEYVSYLISKYSK